MVHRVVALATLSSPEHPRVVELVRALASRGDRVTLFCPPGRGLAPPEVELVPVGPPVSSRPGLRETLRFAAEAGARAALMHLRRRFDVVLLHGGEEATALLGALPRLTGARLVLVLDGPGPSLSGGWRAAAASLARRPALRLVDRVLASDEAVAARLRGHGRDEGAVVVALDRAPETSTRREKQPRLTSRSAVVVACGLGALEESLRALVLEALVLAHADDPRVELLAEGADDDEASVLAEAHGLPVRAAPSRPAPSWRVAMEDVLVAWVPEAARAGVLPYLAVGIPVLTLRAPEAGLEAVVAVPGAQDPAGLAAALRRLVASSRDRRELIRAGWSFVEAQGWPVRAQGLFAAVDGLAEG